MPSLKEPNTWGRWERGEVSPGPQYFDDIAQALEISQEELGRRYSERVYDHYFPEVRERPAAYGEEKIAAMLDAIDLEGLPSEIQGHLFRQRDSMKSQIHASRLAAGGLENQVASFDAVIVLLRRRFDLIAAGSEIL
jgi:hypothetical protein